MRRISLSAAENGLAAVADGDLRHDGVEGEVEKHDHDEAQPAGRPGKKGAEDDEGEADSAIEIPLHVELVPPAHRASPDDALRIGTRIVIDGQAIAAFAADELIPRKGSAVDFGAAWASVLDFHGDIETAM